MSELNPAERELITKLVEEASEVIKEACKMLNHGKLAIDDNGFRYNNVKKLSIETGNFLNMVELCRNSYLIDGQIAQESWDKKRDEIWQYLKHNKRPKRFMVLKNLQRWDLYFTKDPYETGLLFSNKRAPSDIELRLGIAPYYYKEEDAIVACIALNMEDPDGYYGICPVIEQ